MSAEEKKNGSSDEDSVDRPLNAQIFLVGFVDNLKFSGLPVLLVHYDPGNVPPAAFSHK